MSDDKKDEKWYYTFLPYNIAGGSTNPIIPLFVTEGLKGTVAQVGIVSAITSLAAVPANILWGNLSDTMQKRKPFIIMGFLGMGLALLLMGLSTSIPQYYLANFMLGLLAAAVAPVGTVLVLESFDKKDWAKRLGDFSKVGGLGWVVGLLIGTVWLMLLNGSDGENSTRALFLLAAVLCLVSTVLAFRWVPEPKEKIKRECIDPEDLGTRPRPRHRTGPLPAPEGHVRRQGQRQEPEAGQLPCQPETLLLDDLPGVRRFPFVLRRIPHLPEPVRRSERTRTSSSYTSPRRSPRC